MKLMKCVSKKTCSCLNFIDNAKYRHYVYPEKNLNKIFYKFLVNENLFTFLKLAKYFLFYFLQFKY